MNTHVLVVNWNDSVMWCSGLVHPYTVVSSFPTLIGTIPNIAFEHFYYLKYIIDNYDCLPNYSIFCHGHRGLHSTGHHLFVGDMKNDLLINSLQFTQMYFNFNPIHVMGAQQSIQQIPGLEGCFDKYRSLLEPMGLGDVDFESVRCKKYSQFYVHRKLITKHPLSAYQSMLNTMIRFGEGFDRKENLKLAVLLEHSWHLIFLESLVEPDEVFEPKYE